MTDPSSQNFFYSNLFIAIITFVVGTFGLYLYYRRKTDDKRRLAKIILLEIENAETQLKEARSQVLQNPDDPLPEHLYTMPTDSWSRNKHLFVEDFKPSEWSSINQFYDTCQLFDEAIKHNDSRFAEQEKEVRRNVHKATYKYTIQCCESIMEATSDEGKQKAIDKFFTKRDHAVRMLTDAKYIYVYTPSKQNQIVKSCIENTNVDLSLNIVGQKFEKLSKAKLKPFGIV